MDGGGNGNEDTEHTEELMLLEGRMKQTKDRRMYERLQTIRLRLMGMPVREISRMLCLSEKTLRKVIYLSRGRSRETANLCRRNIPLFKKGLKLAKFVIFCSKTKV
jgi:hypothetical protein